jgi:GNAT superfamily N-acetyltransferase
MAPVTGDRARSSRDRPVERVAVAEVLALRYHVLRRDTPSDVADFDGDDDPRTVHLAIRDEQGVIIATSTWLEQPFPDRPTIDALQLRGMAVHEEHQGRGLGAQLIEAGVELARERGLDILWANARDTALGFYHAQQMMTVGEGFVTHDTRLPHHRVVRAL